MNNGIQSRSDGMHQPRTQVLGTRATQVATRRQVQSAANVHVVASRLEFS